MTQLTHMTQVAVVGSANLDLVVRTPTRPARGETVIGSSYEEHVGGKGANQALASAARARTAFVGAVGDDEAARLVRAVLAEAGVDLSGLADVAGPTGRAVITVTPDGENDIVVLPLASGVLSGAQIAAALDALAPAVVAAQLEISEAATEAVAEWCAQHPHTRLVLNASPVRDLPAGMIGLADPLIVNEGEARALLGADRAASDDALALGLARRARSVVLTRGERGALVATGTELHAVAGVAVERVVDTTGAGDAFAGTLAAELGLGRTLAQAAEAANAAAAQVVAHARGDRRTAASTASTEGTPA